MAFDSPKHSTPTEEHFELSIFMFIYTGKLNSHRGVFLSIATFIYTGKLIRNSMPDEMITVIFPKGFELSDPVIAFWSCSNDSKLDNKKTNVANYGVIQTVAKTSDGNTLRIHFSFGSYSFDGFVPADFQTLSLTMNDWMSTYPQFDLTASPMNAANVRSAVVYTGSLKWDTHAEDEMVTIVIPHGVTNGRSFGLYCQWTRDPITKAPKQSVAIKGEFRNVSPEVGELSSGSTTATYEDEAGYRFTFTFDSDKEGSLVLSHCRVGGESARNRFVVAYKQ